MWGIIPAAGAGSRIQPLAFSKELLPVGSRFDGEIEKPRAVSEYLIERMLLAKVDKLCIVISPDKTDIIQYYGGAFHSLHVSYTVQPRPLGLCDAVFRALPLMQPEEMVIVGLPDTIWFPSTALNCLGNNGLYFLLFPVKHPELFDAVETDETGRICSIRVKQTSGNYNWIWGAFKTPAATLMDLHALWRLRGCKDQYIGELVNAYLAEGGAAFGVKAGISYVDVGTLHGYREAMKLLAAPENVPQNGLMWEPKGSSEHLREMPNVERIGNTRS
jgi:glucose-1-phosphate thymidylyltransferase